MGNKRALIVEDQGITAMYEHQMMLEMGYEVTNIVMTGEKAIEHAKTDKPDIILMDIRLAGEISGIEAALKIKQEHDIPIIYVTAYGDKKIALEKNYTVPDGFGYVVKPFKREELLSEINRLLSKQH